MLLDTTPARGFRFAPNTALFLVLTSISLVFNYWLPFPEAWMIRPIGTTYLAICALQYARNGFTWLVAAGMFFGLLGDIYLAPNTRDWFFYGVGAYALGHLFYILAFMRDLRPRPKHLLVLLPLYVYAGYLAWRLYDHIGNVLGEPDKRLPILGYVGMLLTMTTLAVIRHRPGGFDIAFGAVWFAVSDSLIAINYILSSKPDIVLHYAIVITYALAQYLIVFGAANEETRAA